MPAYCVATNCNNSQTTPGITMHELPRNRLAVRRKWITFIQFKRSDFLAAPHHAPLCSEHFSECDFAKPMEYRYSFKILPGRLKLIQLYPCGSLGQSISFRLRSSSWPFCSDSHTTENAFFRAFITLRSQFHLRHPSQRALTEIVSKITPNLGLVL